MPDEYQNPQHVVGTYRFKGKGHPLDATEIIGEPGLGMAWSPLVVQSQVTRQVSTLLILLQEMTKSLLHG